MYGADLDAKQRVQQLIDDGWTKVEITAPRLNRFFEMKDWCNQMAGELGEAWINVNLRTFLFVRKDLAALFKLTFA